MYCKWSSELEFLSKSRFCRFDSFKEFLEYTSQVDLQIDMEHNRYRQALRDLSGAIDVGQNRRFPDKGHFVCLQTHRVSRALERIRLAMTVCEYRSSHVQNPTNAINDPLLIFSDALTELYQLVDPTNYAQLVDYGIYCRETFEEKYKLTWLNYEIQVHNK